MREIKTSDTAKRYQAIKIKLFFIELLLTLAYLLIFQFSGLSNITASYASLLFESRALIIAFYLFIFGGIYFTAFLPLRFYRGFVLEKKYQLSNQTLSGWLKDGIKETALSSAIFLILTELFYFVLMKSESRWWLWVGFFWFLFSVIFARVFPILIVPLFYKYKKIENTNLRQGLIDLVRRSGIDIVDIFQIDYSKKTKKANAALAGLGKSKRIILTDTLLSGYNNREIQIVLAHELGHYKYRHIWKLILFGAVNNLLGFYLIFISTNHLVRFLHISGIYDIEAFPAISLILLVFGVVSMPLTNGYSRRLEKAADLFSLAKTNDNEAFISCMRKLGEQNFSDFSPNRLVEFLLYDHPPISKRIRLAEGDFR